MLVDLGLYDVVLPFLFVFSISYGILEKAKPFGKGKDYNAKNAYMMISFVLGFIAVSSLKMVGMIHEIISRTVILTLGAVMVLLLAGIFGVNNVTKNPKIKVGIVILALFGVGVIMGDITGFFEKIKIPMQLVKGMAALVLIVSIFVLIIWWIVKDTDSKQKKRSSTSSSETSTTQSSSTSDDNGHKHLTESDLNSAKPNSFLYEQNKPPNE